MTVHRLGKVILSQLLCIGTVFTACTDEEVVNQVDKTPLQVSVNTSLTKQSRAIVHGEWLPSGSTIGVSLFDTEGDDYDGQGYYNIQYKGNGEEEDQVWSSMGVTPAVSANEAVLVAYHPYNDDENLDITAIPVEIASQTDYMYSGLVTGITNAAPKADIVLDHALTAIRVKLVLGDFTGDASVSEIAVASPALASSATLNAANGSLDNIAGQGDKFALPVDFGLVTDGTDNDIMLVPDASVESGVTTVSATIGGKKYTAGIEFDQAYKQGYIYTYTLTLNNSGFAVTKVNVNPWETGADDSAVLQPEKDNAYIIKIVASYKEPGPISLLDDEVMAYNNSQTISSRSANTFYFEHNMVGFVGTIDWGDGTTDTYDESVDLPYHFYVNDGQEYTITAKGVINELSSNAQQFKHCLKELIKIGKDCKIESMEFAFTKCSNLTEIKPGALDGCEKVTNFGATFYGCSNLQTVPVGLFDKCTKVTTFISDESENIGDGLQYYSCFGLCYSLNEIPEGLFDNCTEVTDFGNVFRRCVNLRNIPEGLFDKCTKVTSFRGTFEGCEILTSIPEGLFDNCTKVTDFSRSFARSYFGGDMRITTIPEGLFDNCTKVTDFGATFYGCSSLIGESPYTIINVDGEDVKVHLYERANYPEYFTEPEWIYSCFNGCEGLTDYNTIPSDWK